MNNEIQLDYTAPSTVSLTTSRNPILWAIYLGISWTWVIGMFLPVLLIRDYGFWAWVIFAIPNCVGAAAMGWVMRSGVQSEAFVLRHVAACRVFSLVTIAFHLFFSTWILPRLLGPGGWLVAAVLVQAACTPLARRKGALAWSLLTFVASLVIAVLLAPRGVLSVPISRTVGAGDLIGLGLVCLFGFIACPYFDLTFHRARQRTSDAGAKIAFGVGFLIVFASMIVLTLLYATSIFSLEMRSVGAILLSAHLGLQMLFTVSVHAGTLFDLAEQRDEASDTKAELGFALAVGLAAGMLQFFLNSWGYTYNHMSYGEVFYRLFMSFYGLLFPAYAVTSMLSRHPHWRATGIAVILAMPFYWMAFIERQMAWASAGVAIAVIVGLVLSKRRVRAVE